MKLEISYATMSYLRDLVRKEQVKHFTKLFGVRINVPPNKMQEEFDTDLWGDDFGEVRRRMINHLTMMHTDEEAINLIGWEDD